MKTSSKFNTREIMTLAWQMVKRNGMNMSDALKTAWLNVKLRMKMYGGIAKFYFQKVDGSIREAYGTLNGGMMPETAGADNRKKNDTVQPYFDTEKGEWRCFKKANIIRIAY